MSGRKEKLASLRTILALQEDAGLRIGLDRGRMDACLGGGLKRGALHEVFAAVSHEAAATGFAAALARRIGGPLLWIRQDYCGLEHGELAATGLFELGLDPSRLISLHAPDAAGVLRAASDALSCAALGAVVIEITGDPRLLDLVAYRKLALGAGQSGVTALLLRFSAEPGIGVAETRWLVRAAPSGDADDWGCPLFDIELQRNRHGQTGCWVMEWSCDNGIFRPATAGAVVSMSADRSAATAMVA